MIDYKNVSVLPLYGFIKAARLERTMAKEADEFPMRIITEAISQFLRPTTSIMGQGARQALVDVKFKFLKGQYRAALDRIITTDSVLKEYKDKESLGEAYKVMIKFAPNLASEPRVARSFLRAFIANDGIISEQHIKLLVDAEDKYQKTQG